MLTFGFLTPATSVVLLIIALIIFGPGKLPDIGKSLGRGIREFKAASDGISSEEPKKEVADAVTKPNSNSQGA